MSYLFVGIALALAIHVFLLVTRRHVWFDLKDGVSEAVRDAKAELHQKKWEARNPIGEPLSEAEGDAILAAYRALARPALVLKPDPATDALTAPARLGGPAWLADGETWPLDAEGQRLEFVAQVDFAALPRPVGFPEAGVARFFVGRDELWGANFDEPDCSEVRVLWHDGPLIGGRHEPPPPLLDEDYSPFQDTAVRDRGLALRPVPVDDLPDYYSWQAQGLTEGLARRPGIGEVEDRIGELAETREFAHKIGGHPAFTQYDFRQAGKHDEFDALLLGLSSDDAIMWGDVGEAMFMIRPDDLARRDFSRVAFYWDCH